MEDDEFKKLFSWLILSVTGLLNRENDFDTSNEVILVDSEYIDAVS